MRYFYLILISLIAFYVPVQAQSPPEVATWYDYPDNVTRSGYQYNEINVPFVAVDDSQVHLLHHIVIGSVGGKGFRAVVLDTGYLFGYCVEQTVGCYPIALDMSYKTYHDLGLEGLSTEIDWWIIDQSVWWGKL